MDFYIYILYSEKANKYYIGHTSDVNRRLFEHNNPEKSTKFTAKYLPLALVHPLNCIFNLEIKGLLSGLRELEETFADETSMPKIATIRTCISSCTRVLFSQ